MSKQSVEKELGIREKIGLLFILIALKIIQPTEYSHEISGLISTIKEAMGYKKEKYE